MKPKLIHVITSIGTGGTEQGILTLVRHGFYSPFDLHIMELYPGSGPMREELIREIGRDRLVTLTNMQYVTEKNETGISRFIRRMKTYSQRFYVTAKLAGSFENLKPDVLILSDANAQFAGRTAATFFPNVKIASFEHLALKGKGFFDRLLRLSSLRSDVVFGDTADSIEIRESSYLKPQKSFVVPLTILKPHNEHVIRHPDSFKIVSLGRLSEQKNYTRLIEAVVQLRRERLPVELVIAGEGDERPNIEELIRKSDIQTPQYDIARHITLAGWVSDSNSRHKLLNDADIYVQPSLYEGFCIATAEALSEGLPVAATDFAGTHEYGTRDNMIKISGDSAAAIADTLRYMVHNYDRIAPEMSRAALSTVKNKYNEVVVCETWSFAQKELLFPRRPAPAGRQPPKFIRQDRFVHS